MAAMTMRCRVPDTGFPRRVEQSINCRQAPPDGQAVRIRREGKVAAAWRPNLGISLSNGLIALILGLISHKAGPSLFILQRC
jgi:hypothetical protein